MIRRAATLAIAIAAAACTSATDQGDSLPGRGEYIVYSVSATAGGNAQLFRIRPDGTQKLQMTDPVNGNNDSPSFNSDGNTVLFVSTRDSTGPSGGRMIYKTSIDATVQTRVTANSPQHCFEYDPRFAADDKTIVFALSCDTTGAFYIPLIFRINADGSGQARVVPDDPTIATATQRYPGFTTSGTAIVFAATPAGSGTEDIFVMDLDGRNTHRLTNLAAEGRTVSGRVTMLGNSVYFVTIDGNHFNNGQLEAIGADGTGRTVLLHIADATTFIGVQDQDFTVSPDGHSIAFVRRADFSSGALMKAATDGTGATTLDASGNATLPAWK